MMEKSFNCRTGMHEHCKGYKKSYYPKQKCECECHKEQTRKAIKLDRCDIHKYCKVKDCETCNDCVECKK